VTTITATLQQFKQHLADLARLSQAAALLNWDLETGMPRKGAAARAEALGLLSGEIFTRFVSPQTAEALAALTAPGVTLDATDAALVRVTRRDYDKSQAIPPALVREIATVAGQAQPAWEQARHDNTFAPFVPYLTRLLALKCEVADIVGHRGNRYDALLDDYEPGLTAAALIPLIADLRRELVPLVDAIIDRQQSQPAPAVPAVPVEAQRALALALLDLLHFDSDAGRLDASAHPFSITIAPGDHRVTTRFDVADFRSSFFSVLHECGHALYELGIPAALQLTPLADGASMAIHESQSRFWENVVGRSRPFLAFVLPLLQRHCPALAAWSADDLFRSANSVRRSLIRTEADEVTYNLHVMLRFELENELLGGRLAVTDLPAAWNDRCRALLGCTPASDREGVLQDVHWAHGSFGYFPSYMLGNLYAAQLTDALRRDLPDFDTLLARGDTQAPLAWLRDRVHRHGRMLEPHELMLRATGSAPDSRHFLAYLRSKFLGDARS